MTVDLVREGDRMLSSLCQLEDLQLCRHASHKPTEKNDAATPDRCQ